MQMSRYKEVDTARVSRKCGSIAGRQIGVRLFGDPAHSLLPHVAIALQKPRSHDFGQRACGETAQRVHLPETVLRSDIALQEKCVVQILSADVRLTVCIE